MARTTSEFAPPLNQIALSVVDLRLTERWFRKGFGLLAAGGSRALMRGPLAITLKQSGGQTELDWSIRFRPKVAGTGGLLQKVLQSRLRTMLNARLKPYIESGNTEPAVG